GASDVTMANTRGTVPVSADPVSTRMKSKNGKNSDEKQNETDKNQSESRVYIGAASSRWRELRERSHFRTDADLALFLLDWYENQPVTSTPSEIVRDRPGRLHSPSAGAEPLNDQAIITTSEAVIKYLSRKTPPLPPPPPHPPSQVCEDVKTESSDGGTPEVTEVCVKKEETLELDIHKYEDDLDNTPEDICVKEEDPDHKDYLYCEVCKSVFFNKCEVHGPPLFIPDTPVPLGVSDRARLTLPPGLEIQKSGIPDAGLGVFNKGETVPVGAHFGPYQGELVDREEAMNSGYSWVIYRSRQCEEYIDATRETESNWMRYVNCACNDEEQNLVAFQYRGGILYRCYRPINPGQELLVWYEEEYAKDLRPEFDYLWNKKCSTNESNNALLQSFSCSTCFLSYASQIYLHKHIQRCHYEEYMRLQESGDITTEPQISSKGCSSRQISQAPDVTMANCQASKLSVPVSAETASVKKKGKKGEKSEEEQGNQKASDKNDPGSGICIGAAFSRWRELRERSHFQTDADLALFLLDWYEKQPVTSTPSDIVRPAPSLPHPPTVRAEPVNDQAVRMSTEGHIRCFSRKTRAPDPPPAQQREDVKTGTSCYEDDGTSENVSIKEEHPDPNDCLYCEICKSVFFNKCEVHGPPLFIPDTPVPLGVSDRARLTLPPGLEIQKSGIPDAGLGVFNKGETVPVGAHFGPYQGELVDREEAKNSGYSWVIYRSRQCDEYIDATRETESNWMRYVNCAHNDEEQNLVAFQYRGGILYRCCRPINPGQELLVWYEEEYAKDLSPAFDYLWNKKCSTN
ncbi:histone-lysine N-methyltransferase PRDM9-like, partial [Clarias magur]